MKIGLIDIDSKMPNLALMKLSAYYKSKGYQVEMTVPIFAEYYDRIYASKIFDFSYVSILPEKTIVGGSGFSLKTKLDEQIEHIMPDYSLYPGFDYSLGFTTRGCNRNCPFCIVPKKEGEIRFNADIEEFWNPAHKKIILLDNNIFALNGQFERISNQILRNNLQVDFNQGLDIRLLTEKKANILKKLSPINYWRFAWDNIKDEDQIIKGLEMLKRFSFKSNIGSTHYSKILFYILIGYFEKDYDQAIKSALYRIKIINKDYGFEVFAMPYNNDNKYYEFARYVNRKSIFYSNITWNDYNTNIRNKK